MDSNWKIEIPVSLKHIASMLSYPPSYYQKRLEKIGFSGKKTKMLDAACGCGIWAIAASALDQRVEGIDATEKYLAVGRELQKQLKIKNLKLQIGKLEDLPYPNEYFDYIICYNAWMYTERQKSIQEMYRVLKPSGRIYLGCISGLGYYLMLALQGIKEGNRGLLFLALRAIRDRAYMTEKEAKKLLLRERLEVVEFGSDGRIGQKSIPVKSQYKDKFLGFWCVFEILVEKTG